MYQPWDLLCRFHSKACVQPLAVMVGTCGEMSRLDDYKIACRAATLAAEVGKSDLENQYRDELEGIWFDMSPEERAETDRWSRYVSKERR
jgi:hypothetical protein